MTRAKALFKYCLSRLLLAPIMLWIISSLVFLLLRVAPGDPVDAILGNRADYAAREAMRIKLGLDLPLINFCFLYNVMFYIRSIKFINIWPVSIKYRAAKPYSRKYYPKTMYCHT